jgi:hypothetical protein
MTRRIDAHIARTQFGQLWIWPWTATNASSSTGAVNRLSSS